MDEFYGYPELPIVVIGNLNNLYRTGNLGPILDSNADVPNDGPFHKGRHVSKNRSRPAGCNAFRRLQSIAGGSRLEVAVFNITIGSGRESFVFTHSILT